MELLVVIVLIGVLAGMTEVGWSRIQKLLAGRSAMAELRNALVLARSDATTRDRSSGVLIDPANRRYLRFVDSTGTGTSDGLYSVGERLLQNWTALPKELVFLSIASSGASTITTRGCGSAAGASSAATQSGTYAIVFGRDGSSMATLSMRLLPKAGSADTFSITVFPPGGLVAVAH